MSRFRKRSSSAVLVIVAAWWFLLNGGGMPAQMAGMPATSGMPAMSASPAFWPLAAMWVAMMAAMMLPGAMPWIATLGTRFAAGYLMVWAAFGAGAALVEWLLHRAGSLSGTMALNGTAIAAVVVAAVGVYELTPLKSACLRGCKPEAARGAGPDARVRAPIVAGIRQGVFCVGCCWALMALMFVAGVMNVVAMLALTAFIALEKLLPARAHVPRIAGAGLLLGAVLMSAGVRLSG